MTKDAGKRFKRTPLLIIVIIVIIVIGPQLFTFFFPTTARIDPWGKVLFVKADSKTHKKIKISGETQDIKSGFYIWLVLTNHDQTDCMPQKRVLRNTRFQTSFFVTALPTKDMFLAMYILDEDAHRKWQHSADQKKLEKVKCLPEKYLLDIVEIKQSYD